MSTALSLLAPLVLALAVQAEPASDASAAAVRDDVPVPEKIPSPPSEQTEPTVSIRTGENGDRIEEYRLNGQVTMVRVTPQRGPTYTLVDSNGDGRLDEVDAEPNGGIAPVYWTVYEWN